MNDRARGPSANGAVQRAGLFNDVDRLMEWKTRLTQWMKGKDSDVDAILRGCHALLATDKAITARLDVMSERLDAVGKRVDIVNKRLRILEEDRK